MSKGLIVLMACGSFSPPTYMHLRMFEIAKDYIHSLGLGTVVGGIVSPVHDAYGKKDLVAAQHRIAMLKLALRTSGWIKISEWETQQSGWTRTRVSLQYHQDTINNHMNALEPDPPTWLPDDVLNVNSIDEPDSFAGLNGNQEQPVTIKLLCGADLLESFATPGLWSDDDIESIVGHHGLVVVTRAGSDPGRFIHESDLLYKHRQNIMLVTNYIANEVSSTVIRRLVRRGESAKYLTDDAVLAYMRAHTLYGAATKPHHTSVPTTTTDTTLPHHSTVTSNGSTSRHYPSVPSLDTTSHNFPRVPCLTTSQNCPPVPCLHTSSQHSSTIPSLDNLSQRCSPVQSLRTTSQDYPPIPPLRTTSQHYSLIPSLSTNSQPCPPVPPLDTISHRRSPIPSSDTIAQHHSPIPSLDTNFQHRSPIPFLDTTFEYHSP